MNRVAAVVGARVLVTDIDGDPELAVDWALRIPVVRAPDGSVLDEGRVGFWRLLRAAAAARLEWSVTRRFHRS